MIAVILCVLAIVFFFMSIHQGKTEVIPKCKNKAAPEIDLRAAWDIETRERIKTLDRRLELSELTGAKVILDLDGLPEHHASLICLRALLSDANCEIIHKGKHLPTVKQVIEKVANEPRRSP